LVRAGLLLLLSAALVTASWLRLEELSAPWGEIGPVLGLALVPVLAARLTRSPIGVAVALLGSALFAASIAFEIPLGEARPGDPQHDFFGPVLDRIRQGFLDFYDAQLPFNRLDFQLMHAVVVLAIFGFVALIGVFLARGRPVPAALVLVAGVGWPATLNPGGSPLGQGALALVGVLAMLFLLRTERRPVHGLVQAGAVGVALIGVALLASTTEAVAKTAFLSWKTWDPYDRPDDPVSVNYVWSANYRGIDFPEKKTTVLRIKAEGTRRALYWRATTLDDYTGQAWAEDLDLGPAEQREQVDAIGRNTLLPEAARNEKNWIRQDVTVEALRDRHLIGSAQPVRWRTGTDATVQDERGDIVVLPRALRRDQRYSVWSYVPRPKPSELIEFRGNYPQALDRYLEFVYEPLPDWATEGRSALMAVYFDQHVTDFSIDAHRPVYEIAAGVTANARSPYGAALALETWFRQGGGFRYSEHPGLPLGGVPPLVTFVADEQVGKIGYCQHYAGAMALMLRLLGIPARVAAGFTSGSYDTDEKEWVVTDHNAHAWVEVWFPKFGWLPFDPTPGRGRLAATYSVFSQEFNALDAAEAAGGELTQLNPQLSEAIRSRIGRPGQESAQGFANAGRGGAVAVVRDKGPSLFLLLLLVLGSAYAAVVGLKAIRRSVRFSARDPRELASACRRDIVGYLADQGLDLSPSLTLPELGKTLDRYYAVNADNFVQDLSLARFGRPDEARAALRRARRELRDVRRALRGSLSLGSRLRGAASLRSLAL
jgi:transglutaminase-like putative cysteine protease